MTNSEAQQRVREYLESKYGPGHGQSFFLLTDSDRTMLADQYGSVMVAALHGAAPSSSWVYPTPGAA